MIRRLDTWADVMDQAAADEITEWALDGTDTDEQRHWPATHSFSKIPTEGGEVTTPVEARGCPDEPRPGGVSATGSYEVGRAAGALMTGQCQDGSSQAPADAQYPAPAHAGRGSHSFAPSLSSGAENTSAASAGLTTERGGVAHERAPHEPGRPSGPAADGDPGDTVHRNLLLVACLRDHADTLEPGRRTEALRLAWRIEADLKLNENAPAPRERPGA